ncbi:MAG TPA: ATP-binding protein, partial [Acidimicrobiales bacterium]
VAAARGHGPASGALVGVFLVVVATAAMVPFRDDIARASPGLVLVVPIVIGGVVGGRVAAAATAAAAVVAFNLAFIPPYWAFDVHALDDTIALVVFGFVAAVVGTLVAREGDRRHVAEQRAGELGALNEELQRLEDERSRLAEEATRAVVLEQVDQQRAALLRSVSHDLRTPLAGIQAIVSDLLSETRYDDDVRAELLGLVADETARLDRLVANLLNLSRIEAGALKPDRRPFAIDEVAADAVRRLARLFAGKRVQLEFPADLPLVRGDYLQIEQVITNLLENAARHAPPSSMVRIGGGEVGDDVEVWVDDQGHGVTPFERKRIFEPFRAGEGSASSGVGLAICKAIVEAHDGTIRVDGSSTGGARFAFRIPQA